MQLSALFSHIKGIVVLVKPFTDESIEIDTFRLFDKNQTQFVSKCLYIGAVSALPTQPPCTDAALLCVEDQPLSKAYEEATQLNLCTVTSAVSQYEILSHISAIMNEEMRLALEMQKLLDIVYSNQGLQRLIDTARELFGHPMLLHDTSFKALAMSYDADGIVDFQEDANGDKYVDGEIIAYIQNNHVFSQIRSHGLSHYVSKIHPLYGTLVSLIQIEGIEVAQLAVYEAGNQFKELDFKRIESFSRLLSVELQKTNLFNVNKNLIPNYILADLLEKQYCDEYTVNQRFHYLKWIKSETFCIMVITNKNVGSFDSKIPFIVQSLKTFIPTNNCIVYKSNLVAFLDDSLINTLFQTLNAEFIEYLEINSLSAGVSLKFSKLSESRKYYLQALKASEIGQRNNTYLSHYEQCAIYIIADLISSQYDPIDFCHPAVLQLAREDIENGTDLLETLKDYIYFTTSPNEAAKALSIHRNTLFYRINKITLLTFNIGLDSVLNHPSSKRGKIFHF
jgi:hypothetical protein